LFTRGAAKDGFSAGATYGSDATQQLFADGAMGLGDRLRLGFGGGHAESEGMPVFVDDQTDRGHRNVTGRASLEYRATDTLSLRARAWHAQGRTEYSTQTFSDPPYANVSQAFENGVYSVEGEFRGAEGLALRTTLSRATDDIEQKQANFANTPESPFDFARTTRDTADLQLDLPELGGHAVSVGLQRSAENANALSFGTSFDRDTHVTQAFVQDQFAVGPVGTRLAVGHVHHQTFGNEFTWNAELGFGFGTGTRVTLSGGKAFRAPDGTDRFGYGGNPDLQPEVSRQVELSIRQKIGAQQQLTLTGFDNRVRDLITYVFDPVTFDGRNLNIDRARIRGVELGWQFTGQAWKARAELTLQDPRSEVDDQRLLRRSRESLTIAVNRDVGDLDLGVDVAAHGNLDSYALLNATVRYRVTSAFTVQGRLENLLDEDYTLAEGYRTEGRAYTIGVRYSFQ
jgi:vitamin B12 transporter